MTPKRTDIPDPSHPDAPKYWRNEMSGALGFAMRVYLECPNRMDVGDIRLVRAYLIQWIDSPVWDMNPGVDLDSRVDLAYLRLAAREITGPGQIRSWLKFANDMGIDPL